MLLELLRDLHVYIVEKKIFLWIVQEGRQEALMTQVFSISQSRCLSLLPHRLASASVLQAHLQSLVDHLSLLFLCASLAHACTFTCHYK